MIYRTIRKGFRNIKRLAFKLVFDFFCEGFAARQPTVALPAQTSNYYLFCSNLNLISFIVFLPLYVIINLLVL